MALSDASNLPDSSSSSNDYTPSSPVPGSEVPFNATNHAGPVPSRGCAPPERVPSANAPREVMGTKADDVAPASSGQIQEPRPLSSLPDMGSPPLRTDRDSGMTHGKLFIITQCLATDSLSTPRPFLSRPDSLHLITDGSASPDALYAKITPHVALCRAVTERISYSALERDSGHLLARLDSTYQVMQGALSVLNELLPELHRRSRHVSQTQLEWTREGSNVNDERMISLRNRRSHWADRTHESMGAFSSALDSLISLANNFSDIVDETVTFPQRVSHDCDIAESHFDHIRAVLGVGEFPEDSDMDD